MTASVRILSTSSVDSSPAILIVSTDGSKILVNCGEGVQRCFLEHSQRISSVQAICLSHLAHTAIGGLPGALLTYADVDANTSTPSKKIDIIGPSGSQQFIRSLRHFMLRKDFQFRVHEGIVRMEMNDKSVKHKSIDSMPFTIQSFSFDLHDGQNGLSDGIPTTSIGKRPRSPTSTDRPISSTGNHFDQSMSPPSDRREVLSYLFTSPSLPGKFQAQKAVQLGVPKGPLYGKLKSGQSVTFVSPSGDDITVHSHEVVSPPSPGVAVLVLYYPTREIAEALMTSRELQEALESNHALEVACHLMADMELMQRVTAFVDSKVCHKQTDAVEHIILGLDQPDLDGSPFRSAAASAIARSRLCQDIYRVPKCNLLSVAGTEVIPTAHNFRLGRSMMEFRLVPRSKKGFIQTSLPPFPESEPIELAEKSGAVFLAKQVHGGISLASKDFAFRSELVFTGTASSLPCKYRNVTGMALKADNGRWFLLDVGESTIGNLLRTHDDLDGQGSLANVMGVWVSHPHADHHLGLVRLLQERRSKEPLILVAPPPLFRFLDEYKMVERGISEAYIGVNCWNLLEENIEVKSLLRTYFGFTDIRAVPVDHCSHSFGVIIDGTPFGKLVYSGDCRPSYKLAETAKGADLLIHEATFEDGMEADALLKRHSTIGEALHVAHLMQAKTTVLTHFSQRYPKVPPISMAENRNMQVIFAFDYMCLRPDTLAIASRLTPAIRLLFPDEEEIKRAKKLNVISKAQTELSSPGLFAKPGVL